MAEYSRVCQPLANTNTQSQHQGHGEGQDLGHGKQMTGRRPGRPRTQGDNIRRYRSREKERIKSLTDLYQKRHCANTTLAYEVRQLTKERDELQKLLQMHMKSNICKMSSGMRCTSPGQATTCPFTGHSKTLTNSLSHIGSVYSLPTQRTQNMGSVTSGLQAVQALAQVGTIKKEPLSPTSPTDMMVDMSGTGLSLQADTVYRNNTSSRSAFETAMMKASSAQGVYRPNTTLTRANTVQPTRSSPTSTPTFSYTIGAVGCFQNQGFEQTYLPPPTTVMQADSHHPECCSQKTGSGTASNSMRETHQLLASLNMDAGVDQPQSAQQCPPWACQVSDAHTDIHLSSPLDNLPFTLPVSTVSMATGSTDYCAVPSKLQADSVQAIHQTNSCNDAGHTGSARPSAHQGHSVHGSLCTDAPESRIPSVIQALEDEEIQMTQCDSDEDQHHTAGVSGTQSDCEVFTNTFQQASTPYVILVTSNQYNTPIQVRSMPVTESQDVSLEISTGRDKQRLTPVSHLIDTYLPSPGYLNREDTDNLPSF